MARMAALRWIATALLVALASSDAASAVLIATGDGNGNAWPSPYPSPLLRHAGTIGALSAIYLGNGVVLTAQHVGPGDFEWFGISYPWVRGSELLLRNPDRSNSHLLMFAIDPHPNLPPLPIVPATPQLGMRLVVIGNGRSRGPLVSWDPNGTYPPGLTDGYAWASGQVLRWGTNHVEMFPTGRIFNTYAFASAFQTQQRGPEAQAVTGDSGGAAFVYDPTLDPEFALAGVILATSSWAGQPAETSFFGQYTYYADLAYYRAELENAVALPEPSGALAAGAVLLFALAVSRRACAAA
jgi:hypothetical protein